MEAINQPGVNRGSPVRADDPRYLHPPRHQGVFSLALRGFFTLHTYSVVTSSHSLRLYIWYQSTITCTVFMYVSADCGMRLGAVPSH